MADRNCKLERQRKKARKRMEKRYLAARKQGQTISKSAKYAGSNWGLVMLGQDRRK